MSSPSIYNELCGRIENNPDFANKYSKLIKYHYTKDESLKPSKQDLERLLETAAIFALSESTPLEQAAYNISAIVSEDFTKEYPELHAVTQYLFIRLKKFPSLRKNVSDSTEDYFGFFEDKVHFNPTLFSDVVERKVKYEMPSDTERLYFTPFQKEVWEKLQSGRNITVSAPTSAGKSFIFTRYLAQKFIENQQFNAVYIVPTRALIGQVQRDFNHAFSQLNVEVNILTSSVFAHDEDFESAERNLFILTQERLKNLLSKTPFDKSIDLLIVDEAQGVAETGRGILLEEVIEEVLNRYEEVQIVFIVPRAINPEKFQKMFSISELIPVETKTSPVGQNLLFLNVSKEQFNLELQQSEGKSTQLIGGAVEQNVESRAKLKAWAAKKFGTESNIIYCNSEPDCYETAREIFESLGNESTLSEKEKEELATAISFLNDYIHPKYYLNQFLRRGVGIHFGSLPPVVRYIVEDLFRRKVIKHLCTTSTLLQGVNLPAQNIFLYKPARGRSRGLSEISFWNLAGRAGRAVKDYAGNIYCINVHEWMKYKPKVDDYEHEITSALEDTISEKKTALINYLKDHLQELRGKKEEPIEQVVTKYVIKEIRDERGHFIDSLAKRGIPLREADGEEIELLLKNIAAELQKSPLTPEVIERNSHTDPRKLLDLLQKMMSDDSLIIIPPRPTSRSFYYHLKDIYKIIEEHLLKKKAKPEHMAVLSTMWLNEKSLAEIIANQLQFLEHPDEEAVNKRISTTIKKINRDVTFVFRTYLETYVDLVKIIYDSRGIPLEEYFQKLPYYLEMGASSGGTLHLQNLGFSRYSAIALKKFLPKEHLGPVGTKEHLRNKIKPRVDSLGLPAAVKIEVNSLV